MPLAQGMQVLGSGEPRWVEYVPLGHKEQVELALAPTAVEKAPAWQSVHVVALSAPIAVE